MMFFSLSKILIESRDMLKMKKNSSNLELSIMSLNIWGGKQLVELSEYLSKNQDIDIFCFQEIFSKTLQKDSIKKGILKLESRDSVDILEKIQSLLPNHTYHFEEIIPESYGMAIFVKNNISVSGHGKQNIYQNTAYNGHDPSHSRCLQWLSMTKNGSEFCVFNIHGLWNGKGKGDSPERILQSQEIVEFSQKFNAPVIIAGDLNIMPETESIKILEKNNINLIKKFNITSTRSKFYKKSERFADYIFIPHNTQVHNFEVVDKSVSDHLPLVAKINLITE